MKAWKINDTNQIERSEFEVNSKDDIKVRVARVALSETDFDNYLGKNVNFSPIIPAKSALGLISDEDNPWGLKVGERVLLSAYTPCGTCQSCVDGKPHCPNITIRGIDSDGFLSNFAYVNKDCVYPVPDGVTDAECLFYDYISVALSALQRLHVDKGEYVAILGSDIQSIIFAETVSYYQAIPIIISSSAQAEKIASSHGIDYVVNPKKQDVKEKVFGITGGKMAEHAVYSVYSKDSIDPIFSLIQNGGNVGIIGYNAQSSTIKIDLNTLLSRQVNVYCVKEGHKEITSAINMLAMKAINISDFATASSNFSSVGDVFKNYKPGKSPSIVIVDCNDA